MIRVGILPSPAHYIVDGDALYGAEYRRVDRFAEQIGAQLTLVPVAHIAELHRLLLQGKLHIGIPGSTLLGQHKQLRNSVAYGETSWFIVCRSCDNLPEKGKPAAGYRFIVPKNSRQSMILQQLEQDYPGLQQIAHPELDIPSILEQIDQHGYFYTLLDEASFAYFHRIYPRLKKKKKLFVTPLNWVLADKNDLSLYARVNRYLKQDDKASESSSFLQSKDKLSVVDGITFLKQIKTSLPQYRAYFEEAAKRVAIDWRLLAALSYQESHWNPQARSYTGVRGMMMLTRPIAAQLGIENRLDPQASVNGGAQYLRLITDALPKKIQQPDRMWLALAAYNVGPGHLEDARILAQKNGQNPNKWEDVKKNLPLLSKKKWHRQTKHGYARGWEPILFVENIRRYYDVLRLYLLRTNYMNLKSLEDYTHPALVIHANAL